MGKNKMSKKGLTIVDLDSNDNQQKLRVVKEILDSTDSAKAKELLAILENTNKKSRGVVRE